METTKKSRWKTAIIIIAIMVVVIVTVVVVRKNKKAEMIKALKTSGTSLTDEMMKEMSYSDIKKLYEATVATSNP